VSEREYRQDDVRDRGFCPHCNRLLTGLLLSGAAFCEEHGWVFVNFGQEEDEDERDDR
jgi:hypothetical protein